MDDGRRGRSRRVLVAATATAVVLAAGVLALVLGGSGSGSGDASGSPVAGGAAGTVERRTLAERLTATGTIGYAGETTVFARLSGTVTALPKVGDTIRRGERLYELGGEPVLLMHGTVPAYRELAEGVEDGPDVEQLEENLAALGYEPGSVDEEFTATTAAAVGAWQEGLGLEETGAVELGRVAFLPGARRVTAIEATLGEAIGSGGGGNELVAYEPSLEENVESPVAEPEATEPERQEREPEPQPGEEAPPQESQRQEAPVEGEAPDPASVPVLKASSTRRIVSVELDPDQQSVARRGQRVAVLLPGGEEATGKVRRIAATEGTGEEAPGGESEPGVEVAVSIVGKTEVPALDGAAVSVLFTQRVRRDVLSVPLAALLAIGGDRFAVIAIEGANRRRIVVAPGLAADGYVEVEGEGLHEGMRVEAGE